MWPRFALTSTRTNRPEVTRDQHHGRGVSARHASLACAEQPDLFVADAPADLEEAKALCHGCPIQVACLDTALERCEPWGVWGGQLLMHGVVVARKRPRGRPRKQDAMVA